jgi:two-component system, NtrC family, sensor kinase
MANIHQKSILIVDDTPNNIRVLFDILHEAGFKVSVVKSGEMALEKLPLIQPDLILLDVMMPGIDGFETCRCMKADITTKDIPIMFMTALSDVKQKVKGLELGAVDYITKPIQVEEVLARVNAQLKLRNTQIQLLKEIGDRKQAEIQLQHTLKELQKTQAQLIQIEKMSSLGQLVAGIAHEINNPINFIYGNLIHADEYIENLLNLIQCYQQYYPDPVPEVQAEIEVRDLDFLSRDLPKLLDSMKAGANRIREIILSLRVFSRLDESEMKAVDIHEGIDSSLMLLGYRLNDIQVIKQYSNLPQVECYARELNQVFINILNNAIDALLESVNNTKKNDNPTIIICTEATENQIVIRIADNGLGIPEELQKRIFDPFFTTKSVGMGIGLGLAVSYQIITQQHYGLLQCVSLPGGGTEFEILIPLKQH